MCAVGDAAGQRGRATDVHAEPWQNRGSRTRDEVYHSGVEIATFDSGAAGLSCCRRAEQSGLVMWRVTRGTAEAFRLR